MWTIENIVFAIVLGLASTLVFEMLRRFWNPVVWTFTAIGDGYWYLTRTARLAAYDVKFHHAFTRPPIFVQDELNGDGPHGYYVQRLADFTHGFRETVNLRGHGAYGFWMFWVQGCTRRAVEVRVPAGASVLEIRRRDVKSGRKTRAMVSAWGLSTPSTGE